jgi:tRNA(Glu) U13 pseudouridine synthase TruD
VDIKEDKMEKMLYHAYRCLLFNEMLIEQCDGWLPAEEGNRNMEAHIIERNKKENV